MSDTTEPAIRRLRESSPTVDAVCRQLRHQVDASQADLVVAFAEIFFSKAPPDFLHERSTDALAQVALGAFRFLQRARPDRVDVEVINPSVEGEGWYAPVTVLRTDVGERPFIVDTIREYLHVQDLAIEHYIYPVLHVARDDAGAVVEVRPSREGEQRESLVHCEISRVTDEDRLEVIRTEVTDRLQDVVRATDDFDAMVGELNAVVDELAARSGEFGERQAELEEVLDFLRWLRDGAFVFLGYRGYDLVEGEGGEGRCIVVESGSGLGILGDEERSAFSEPVPLRELRQGVRDLAEEGPLLIISKTNAESTVHRRARMDYIGVKKIDALGAVTGEHRFIGLFTSKAFSEDAEHIPILRSKLRQILDEAGVQEGSHDYKEINTIFNSLPKEELFLASAEEIGADVRTVLTTYQTHDVRVTLREDPLQRGVAVMVILPKERFSGTVRRAIEAALVKAFQGDVLNYRLSLGEGDQARLHFYMGASPDQAAVVDSSELERTVKALIRSWQDRVREELERLRPQDEARRLARTYDEAFSPEYRAATEASVAARDILEMESMAVEERSVSIVLSTREAAAVAPGLEVSELKLFLRDEPLILSEFMPILENCGLRVIGVSPFEVNRDDGGRTVVYSFAVQDQDRRPLDVRGGGVLLSEAILAVLAGDATNDGLNALVLTAGLGWREAEVLRALASYAFQVGAVPSRLSLPGALTRYPRIARILFELFEARFSPGGSADDDRRRESMAQLRARFLDALSDVSLLSDDRALRRMLTLLESAVRTNYYRNGGSRPTKRSGGVPYVSFKFAAAGLQAIAKTGLLYEVWVRSSRMEGVHLRGSNVARGGIRWSDRPDDFRTEVLGLVKTQMVKNAVIIPAGSKGGFVTLRHLSGPEEMAREGEEQYRTLMRGLLDLTDNLGPDGRTVPPEDVVCHDPPDPYLVVAADKGTARFSDVANGVAAEYGFWLGDAFASGGSHGYDHKKVGITARGAWECVRLHFREKGKDIQAEPFTVVGIGDMSGDVFGNGTLLSRQIRLLAAFDHRHVFLDPDPDPEASFVERERIFALGRSSWEDYDPSVLSPGGMIVSRGAKEVELTPQAREALGLPEDVGALDGESLIRAVLTAPAELLWNGGIGTYVKASTETHADAGDPSNDAVRVAAPELRCQVVGEGGNLGFTQRARVEYALAGGRLNTDALDNSAGVDMSDHEVNLKILLNPAVRDGSLTEERRNGVLEDLTEAVAELVLEHNRSQSLAISLDEIRAGESGGEFRGLMAALEKAGVLDRASEFLPSFEQLMEREEEVGQGLVRPELCVLLAYAKLHLMQELLASDVPDDSVTESYLLGYFPPRAVMEAGQERPREHRLKREIVASQVTNDVVDLMGATFVHRVVRDTGRSPSEVVRAWLVAARLAGHRTLLQRMADQGQPLAADVAYRWLLGLARVLERTARWVLANVPSSTPTAEVISASFEGLSVLRSDFSGIVAGEDRALFNDRVAEIRRTGADEAFAESLITLRFLDQLLEILRAAEETGSDPVETARVFYRISETLQISWLRQAIFDAAGNDRWEQRAAQALSDDLIRARQRLVAHAMRTAPVGADAAAAVDHALRSQRRQVERFQALLDEIRAEEEGRSLAGLGVAVREMLALGEMS